MHDGSLKTLEEVVEHYDKGGIKNQWLNQRMKPLKLTKEDKADLVAFLKALSGEGWQHIRHPAGGTTSLNSLLESHRDYRLSSSSAVVQLQARRAREHYMTRPDLLKRARQRPFVPFRVVLTEGTAYEVRHPEQIMMARDSAVIGLPSQPEQDYFDTTVLVDLFHIVRLEPVPAKASTAEKA